MSQLDGFDEARASMRMMKALNEQPQGGATVMELYRLMDDRYGVGRTAVDSSLKALVELGLVTVSKQVRIKANILTDRGFKVARVVEELEAALRS